MSSERNLASEVPIRMDIVRPCCVSLSRLTDEEINQSYKDVSNYSEEMSEYPEFNYDEDASDFSYKVSDNASDDSDFEDTLSYNKRFRVNPRKHNLRKQSKSDMFEAYKKRRQKFLNRKSKYAFNSENSMEYSQDEFRNSEMPSKRRRYKRGKYEADLEWDPKSQNSSKMRKRGRLIESDSTSSDDEIFDYLMEEESTNSTFDDNTVPSNSDANESLSSTDVNSMKSKLTESQTNPSSEIAKIPKKKKKSSAAGVKADKTNVIIANVLKGIIKQVCQQFNTKKKYKKRETSAGSVKRVCNAKNNVLKNMAIHDKQRLMFLDVNNKTLAKQYSHCKTINHTDVVHLGFNKTGNTLNSIQSNNFRNINSIKEHPGKVLIQQSSNREQNRQILPAVNVRHLSDNMPNTFRSSDKGLFVMSFPEANKQLGIMQNKVKTVTGSESIAAPVLKSSVNTPFSVCNEMPILQHQTFYLPLQPAIVVSNFVPSSTEFCLKDSFYQSRVTLPSASSGTSIYLVTQKERMNNVQNVDKFSNNCLSLSQELDNNRNFAKPFKMLAPQETSENLSNNINMNFRNLQKPSIPAVNTFSNVLQDVNNLNMVCNENQKSGQLIESVESVVQNPNSKVCNQLLTCSEVVSCQTAENDESSEQSTNNSLEKMLADENFISGQDLLSSACHELGAISILAVIDLEKNPKAALSVRIQIAKKEVMKSCKGKFPDCEAKVSVASYRNDLQTLYLAQKYLNLYGSFSKVSDHFLRKEKIIQIKKEKFSEQLSESTCCFSEVQSVSNTLKEPDISIPIEVPQAIVKTEVLSSCKLGEPPINANHIQKLQSQVASMNNSVSIPEPLSDSVLQGVLQNQMPLPPSMAAPTPVTPRNDYVGGESRETPSRGSGPRTPARPESASLSDEAALNVIQIKRELIESTSSSQCSYSQNSSVPQIPNQTSSIPQIPNSLPVMPDVCLNTINQPVSSNSYHPGSMNNINSMLTSSQSLLSNQTREMPPNRTVLQNKDFYSRYGNVPVSVSNMNSLSRQADHPFYGQSPCFPNGISSRQTSVPSLNNQFAANFSQTSGGVVSYSQPSATGNVNSLLTNISNQQFYTSNQSQQPLYYQQKVTSASPTSVVSITTSLIQPSASDIIDQMFCAVCKSLATLRCKQCAKVAYCNTICAKTYWHQKHKMECKPLPS